jgi:hypothetical protein
MRSTVLVQVFVIAILFITFESGCHAQQSCDYIPGDINSNGLVNGVDVLYAVAYFGPENAPPDSCDCRPEVPYPFYAAGDVNASCSFNGLDVTYFVSYLKGGPNLLTYCPDCPPVGRSRD